jgi:hypothetical protein
VKEPIDWIRATFSGAIFGGVLWAIMTKTMFTVTYPHGPSTGFLYVFLSSVAIAVLAIGVILYFRSRSSFWRSTAIAIILAPLTGWSILLFITITIVLPSHWIH